MLDDPYLRFGLTALAIVVAFLRVPGGWLAATRPPAS
jgi:hypothetical protein